MAAPYYLGIDPGASGGIAVLAADGSVMSAFKMPETDRDLFDVLVAVQRPAVALLERVHAMPKQGVSSTFMFGVGYGRLRMGLTAAKIAWEEVTPRVWQAALGIAKRDKAGDESKTAFKNRLKAKAQQLYPGENVTLATCDALLIATFCYRTRASR